MLILPIKWQSILSDVIFEKSKKERTQFLLFESDLCVCFHSYFRCCVWVYLSEVSFSRRREHTFAQCTKQDHNRLGKKCDRYGFSLSLSTLSHTLICTLYSVHIKYQEAAAARRYTWSSSHTLQLLLCIWEFAHLRILHRIDRCLKSLNVCSNKATTDNNNNNNKKHTTNFFFFIIVFVCTLESSHSKPGRNSA